MDSEGEERWEANNDRMSAKVICTGGQKPTTMPKMGNNESEGTGNRPLASAIRRKVDARRPK